MSIRTRIVKVAAAVTLSGALLGVGSSAAMAADGAGQSSELHKRPNMEYEGQHLTVDEDQSLTRKVNEYEGQHR